MKTKVCQVICLVVAAAGFFYLSTAEAADIGKAAKEQVQKVTNQADTSKTAGGRDVDAQIKAQEQLINKAAEAKTLSKDEAATVRENLKNIKKKKASVSADGSVNEQEQGNVQNMLDRNNKMITDKKNNPVRPFTRPDITHRFENQQRRIDAGLKSGNLTKQEAAALQENLAKAKAKYAELNKDGKFTPAEEEKMHDLLDKDSKSIQSKKRNEDKKKK